MLFTLSDFTRGASQDVAIDARNRLQLKPTGAGYRPRGHYISAVHDLGLRAGSIQIGWVAQWTAPLRWQKHPENPIYGPAHTGAWDSWTNGVSIVPDANGETYKMFYAGAKGEGIGFAVGSVDDPLTWQEHPASPVLQPRADNWEGNLINQPRVVAVTPQHWRMYYTGWGFDGPGSPWALGLAESFDGGVTWRRHGDDPLLERGDALSSDGGGACVPMVLRVQDQWMMWYTAGCLNPHGHQNIHLCLATSPDGMHWEKYKGNPVLSDGFEDGAPRSVTSRCYVRHDEGVFCMWYSFAKPDYRILYAESLDGIHWERAPAPPVLGPSPAPAWDDTMVEYPEIQVVDGIFRMWFCGNGFGSVGYAQAEPETGLRVSVRSGSLAAPDSAWSDWREVQQAQSVDVRQHLQVRAELWSNNSQLSPTLNRIDVHVI